MSVIDMRAAWDEVADVYQQGHLFSTESAYYGPWCPSENELRLLGNVAHKRILELGCGGGQSSIAFARQGAQVQGLDLSDVQLGYARRLAAAEGVECGFYQGSATDLRRWQTASQDIVFSSYALHYIESIERCLMEIARVLIPDGLLVFSLDHPFSKCFWDDEAEEVTLTLSTSYFQRGGTEWNFSQLGTRMRSYYRTIGDWIGLLHQTGLQLERLLEPQPQLTPEEALTWFGTYPYEVAQMVPQTIIFVARRK